MKRKHSNLKWENRLYRYSINYPINYDSFFFDILFKTRNIIRVGEDVHILEFLCCAGEDIKQQSGVGDWIVVSQLTQSPMIQQLLLSTSKNKSPGLKQMDLYTQQHGSQQPKVRAKHISSHNEWETTQHVHTMNCYSALQSPKNPHI